MKKSFALLTSATCLCAFLTLALSATGQSPEAEAKVIALAQQLKLTPTRGQGAAHPQGGGSQVRGDQEQSFASPDAEDEATASHPQRKRTAVAENSEPRPVPT